LKINKNLTFIALKQENNMHFSENDKAPTKKLHLFKGYGSQRLLLISRISYEKQDEQWA